MVVACTAAPIAAAHLNLLSMDTPFEFDVGSALESDSGNFAVAARWKIEYVSWISRLERHLKKSK